MKFLHQIEEEKKKEKAKELAEQLKTVCEKARGNATMKETNIAYQIICEFPEPLSAGIFLNSFREENKISFDFLIKKSDSRLAGFPELVGFLGFEVPKTTHIHGSVFNSDIDFDSLSNQAGAFSSNYLKVESFNALIDKNYKSLDVAFG